MPETKLSTIGAVAARLRLPRWRLAYLIERGDLPAPSVQVPGRRLFTESDVEQLRQLLAQRQVRDAEPRGGTTFHG
jgi:DNA-binding transcriptional MerR regulator